MGLCTLCRVRLAQFTELYAQYLWIADTRPDLEVASNDDDDEDEKHIGKKEKAKAKKELSRRAIASRSAKLSILRSQIRAQTQSYNVDEIFAKMNDCWFCGHLITFMSSPGGLIPETHVPLDHLKFLPTWRIDTQIVLKHDPASLQATAVSFRVKHHSPGVYVTLHAIQPAFEYNDRQYEVYEFTMAESFNSQMAKLRLREDPELRDLIRDADIEGDDDGKSTDTSSDLHAVASKYDCKSPEHERFKQLKDWIHFCDENHQCIKPGRVLDEFLPSRLLKIGQFGRSVRVIENKGPSGQHESIYATLSHCWGHGPVSTLTRANYSRSLTDFPCSELALVFRQAIQLCYDLGIGHIWIDSWCIVQDDCGNIDWQREAPRMKYIYGRSYLNLSAAASQNPNEGLLRPLQRAHTTAISFVSSRKMPSSGRMGYDILCSSVNESWRVLKSSYDRSPLFRRGWVLQEVFLAPRTIHFAEIQMYWSCQSRFRFEKPELELPARPAWKYIFQNSTERSGDQTLAVDRCWDELARAYVGAEFTFSRDRTYALSGLAAHFSDEYRRLGVVTRYLGGCWEHRLYRGMSWIKADEDEKLPKLAEGHPDVPTWSWLSFPKQVAFNRFGLKRSLIQLIKAEVSAKNGDTEFGPLQEAKLTLKAPVFHVLRKMKKCDKESYSEGGNGDSDNSSRGDGHQAIIYKLFVDQKHKIYLSQKPGKGFMLNVGLDYADAVWGKKDPLDCALIADSDLGYGDKAFFAILLNKVHGPLGKDEAQTYTRVGYMKLETHSSNRFSDTFFQLMPKCVKKFSLI